MMKKIAILLLLCVSSWAAAGAQEAQKSELEQRAEAESLKGNVASARYTYIRAFEDYANRGLTAEGVQCAVKATALYYKENYYKEAFELLRRADQSVGSDVPVATQNALHYLTTKERMLMYMKLRKFNSVQDQLNIMESQVNAAGVDSLKNDLLYNKAICYYTFGLTEKGNEVFKEMADKLTADKDYDRVDEVFQTLIANGRKSNNASLVAQSYSNYIAWKDSVGALRAAAEKEALQQQIDEGKAVIADKDSSLSARRLVIIGLCILAAILAGALVLGAIVLLRFIMTSRKQKNTIRQLNENNALKAKFIRNISSQLSPTLQKLDASIPEVKALRDFSDHIQTLAELDSNADGVGETEDIQVQPFCEALMDEIRGKVKNDVELIVKAPKLSATVNKEYVTHILRHLLNNAAFYTPEGGHITLDFKKRSAHTQQFLVWNTGSTIDEEKREDVFKPFLEIKDLATGDGLGLPICKTMAQKMGGDLTIDPSFVKGTRFLLDLHG